MDLAAAFGVFFGAMAWALTQGVNMVWALLAGWAAFMALGLKRKFSAGELLRMSWRGSMGSLVVVRTFVLIGLLTALWRTCGTFAFLVAWGIRLITPSLFVFLSFLLPCGLSYAIGTSFGVAGTLGIILMALARSGGVNPCIVAGAVMSGIYFGDRGSPASSCANLVAALTDTELFDNVKAMMRSAAVPWLLSAMLYLALSLLNPASAASSEALAALEADFNLSPWAALPAVLMILLPLLKVKIYHAFGASIVSAFVCALLLQGRGLGETLRCALWGFEMHGGALGSLLDGGGLFSMVNTMAILLISGTYSGIFKGTAMLEGLQSKIERYMDRWGAFAVTAAAGVVTNGVFCNQTIGVLMTAQIMQRPYEKKAMGREEFALHIADTTVVLAGMIPWCIASSVPRLMMNVPASALFYAFYLYLLPLWGLIVNRPKGCKP